MRERDYERAAEVFERGLQQHAESVDLWFNLGRARSALSDSAAALEAYGRTLQLDPAHVKALNNTANIYFRWGRYEEAGTWYARALEIEPDYLLALFHHGWVLRQLGRSEEAARRFERCLQVEAGDERDRRTQADCLFYSGALRFRQGDYAQAASIMERVLEGNPAHVEARYYLGMAYRGLGRIPEAQRQLEIHGELLSAARRDAPIEKRSE